VHHFTIVLLPLLDWVDESYAAEASLRLMRAKWYFWRGASSSKCREHSWETLETTESQFGHSHPS